MEIRPSWDEVKEYATKGEYRRLPVSCEIMSDLYTPILVLQKLKAVSDHCYLLESAEAQEHWGRYTFLGYNPKLLITCTNGHMKIGEREFETSDPGSEIRKVLKDYKAPRLDYLPSFTGGLVGYFSYDYLKYSEPSLRLDAEDTENFNDVDLMLFDKVIAFDNLRQKIILIVNIELRNAKEAYEKAKDDLQEMIRIIQTGTPVKEPTGVLKSEIRPLFQEDEFCSMVEKAKYHIREGDIFQIVLSNRLDADYEGSLLGCYRMLRMLNPSPYMFYFSGTDVEVAGSSPETLVKLKDGILHTFPLAGTRPRGKTREEDEALEKELLQDPKELAEHNMLVDLGRNDIGKISKFGTVKVETYHEILKFSHVMHIGSTVRGEIRDDLDALNAIDSILPAGTLSGAPKIRACQLINDLENNKRGIYGGAIGYLDFAGNLDTCIAIRIAYKKNGKVFVRSGAGIVADSVPQKEYQESINKAQAVVSALKMENEAGGKTA